MPRLARLDAPALNLIHDFARLAVRVEPEPRQCAVLPGYIVLIVYSHWNAPNIFLHEVLPAGVDVGDSGGVHELELIGSHLVRLGEHAGV